MNDVSGRNRRSQLETIAKGTDYDVANFDNSGKSQKVEREGLTQRQRCLREKLDVFLETHFLSLFSEFENPKQVQIQKEEKTNESINGVQLFKNVYKLKRCKTSVLNPKPKKKKQKKEKELRSVRKDGIPRFKGLAIVHTDQILKDAEKIRKLGEEELRKGSISSK